MLALCNQQEAGRLAEHLRAGGLVVLGAKMYKLVRYPAAIAAVVSCFIVSPSLGQEAETSHGPSAVLEDIQDSFIFVFGPSVSPAEADFQARSLVIAAGGRLRHVYSTAIRGFSANMSPVAAASLFERNPNIAYYEHDGLVTLVDKNETGSAKKPSNPGGGNGGGGSTPELQVVPWGIDRVGGPADGTGLTAWVIDTGIDFDHADLNVDVANSANFVFRGKNSAKDGNGHGTHVAGTMAAIDNDIDVVGVAAGATVVAVRVLDNSGSGSISGVVAGVDYVAANGAPGDVANMSLGGNGHWQSLHDAVLNAAEEHGILFSLAAGNSAAYASEFEPAHVNHANVYTVSAIDSSDVFAFFSNFGNPPVDFAAPGVSVLSTKKGGGTTSYSGTSMAAPHVGGILLLGTPINSDGVALNDPDGTPDPIAHR